MAWLNEQNGGCVLTVKATPRASCSAVAGADADWLRLRLQAPPVDGRANEALVEFLAERLGVPRRAVSILTGETGRLKRVRIGGLAADQIRQRLGVA